MNLRMWLWVGGMLTGALGIYAFSRNPAAGGGILNAGMSLGGIFAICGFFVGKWPQHGLYAAGVMALLGTGGNLSAVWDLLRASAEGVAIPPDLLARTGFAAISSVILLATLRTLKRERREAIRERRAES